MIQSLSKFVYKDFPINMQIAIHQIKNTIRVLGGGISGQVDESIRTFVPTDRQQDVAYINKLKKDIKRKYALDLVKPYEYFLLGFNNNKKEVCDSYLTDIVKDLYCCKYAGLEKFQELKDKFLFYERMQKYFLREACKRRTIADKEAFMAFVKKHNRFIAKPNGGSFGKDTNIYSVTDNAEQLLNELIKDGTEWILEELIVQVAEMGQFNPTSVNSVRIPTFRTKKGIKVFGCFMRTGRSGSVVDNAGVGGIFAKVDEETGVIVSDGCTESGDRFDLHPDSKVQFKGFQIPRWNELHDLAIECHTMIPDHKYVGWDFALTENGWVLMEGNWGQFLCQQVSSQKPMKKQFVELIKG